jgi:hypothetical protein
LDAIGSGDWRQRNAESMEGGKVVCELGGGTPVLPLA